jgi:hypothetical protein
MIGLDLTVLDTTLPSVQTSLDLSNLLGRRRARGLQGVFAALLTPSVRRSPLLLGVVPPRPT